jgi:heat shock protein HtpX
MAQTFRDLIAANRRNSVLLVTCFILFTAVVAVVLALGILAYVSPETAADLDWGRSLLIGLFAAGVAFLVALMSYFAGANLVLSISGAEPLPHKDDPELFNVVEEIAIAAGIPPPKVYLIHDSAPNAFATGRDPRHAVVAITTGLRYKLTRAELQGVMAHEIAHIRNYDIRLMMLMAVLIGTIVMLADLFWQMMYATSRGSRRRDSKGDSKGGSAIVIVLMVLAILLAIIAPILAQIIQLAVSRQREYLADASAVEFTRYPLGLANALRKIDADPDVLEAANRGTAHLYIANPIKKFEARADSMFSSHPPIQERIRRLEALAGVHDPAAKLRVSRSEVPGERET